MDEKSIAGHDLNNSNQFQFRVALLLSENEAIYSDQSVVIHTNEEGIPESPPILLQVSALDQTRIMVSWKPGPKNNGPVLSYKLEINDFISFNLTKVARKFLSRVCELSLLSQLTKLPISFQ